MSALPQLGLPQLGLGHTLPPGGGVPAWVDSSLFDADYSNSRFFFRGSAYATEDLLNTAAGLSKSGVSRVTASPYVDPTLANLLTNGDFSSGTTGWAAFGTGAAIANVAGELELTSGGALNGFSQGVSGILGRAFRFRMTGRRGTSANSVSIASGISAGLHKFGTAWTTTSNVILDIFASAGADTSYFGARNSSGAGTGTHLFGNASLVEVWPFLGWQHNAIGVAIQATAAAGATVDEVLWQADAGDERDRVRVVRLVADDTVHVIVTSNNSTNADLNLGAVADGAQFEVAFSATQNSFGASLNGGSPVTDTSGVCPGVAYMRIGRSFTGEIWTGSIERVTVF